MAYSDEVVKKQFKTNVVLKIGDDYFAQHMPDSGLVIPIEQLIVDDPQVNGTSLDIRQVSTPVGGITFKLKDDTHGDQFITKMIMLDPNNFLEKKVETYVGFKTGSFDFSDYKKIGNTTVKNVTKIANGYSIRTAEVISLLTSGSFNISDKLSINILNISLSLDLETAARFPDQGLIKIDNEFIRYNGKTEDTLENLTRGLLGTNTVDHNSGADVQLVTELLDTNPIDMLLQLMLSKNGDLLNNPTYDVLFSGLGLSDNEVDISAFEAIRDTYFTGVQFRLYLYGQVNTLRFIENEILKATGCRIFSKNGRVSISILDQVDPAADVIELNEFSIIGTPTWTLGSDKIVNVISIRYDYNEANGVYNKVIDFRDDESIAFFGEKPPLDLRFKGITAALSGGAFVSNLGTRLLTRMSTPRGDITARAHFDASEIDIGENIILNHRFLPKQGAGLGIYDQLEVMSTSIDLKTSVVVLKLQYTSFTGIRVPYIAPSPFIVSVINQRTFEVPDGSCFAVGYGLRLWNKNAHTYYADTVNIIESINGNIITMANDFTTILTTDIRIKMADYNFTSQGQRNRYASIGENTGFFDDGTKSYQVIF